MFDEAEESGIVGDIVTCTNVKLDVLETFQRSLF